MRMSDWSSDVCSSDLGMDAAHVHMTNTSNLPVESMELEFPVVVERYELTEDSGGAGEFRGGMGITREFRMYGEDLTVALGSDRQKFTAQGELGRATCGKDRCKEGEI